ERGDLFASVLAALADLATERPVVVFVEDVHWADQATRDLLGFLFTRLRTERIALIVSYRSDDLHRRHALRPTLAEWARLPIVDLPTAALDGALRDALDAHILQVTPSGRGYTFRHALLAEAVYEDLLPGERVRLHAAYAAVIAGRTDRSAAELARHARASHDY